MRTVIVTGSSGQLGQAICSKLINQKNYVIGIDIEPNSFLDKEKNFTFKKIDITCQMQVQSFYSEIKKNFDNIYGLINNAGVAVFSPLEKRTAEELIYVTKVNNFAPIYMTQGFIQVCDKNLFPSIINLGSIYGISAPDQKLYSDTPRNSSEIYGMTKAAIINLTKYLAVYLSKYNIRCNCVSPGGIHFKQGPGFIKNYSKKVPMGRMANVEEILGAIIFLLDNDNSSYINGTNISVDGGFTSW